MYTDNRTLITNNWHVSMSDWLKLYSRAGSLAVSHSFTDKWHVSFRINNHLTSLLISAQRCIQPLNIHTYTHTIIKCQTFSDFSTCTFSLRWPWQWPVVFSTQTHKHFLSHQTHTIVEHFVDGGAHLTGVRSAQQHITLHNSRVSFQFWNGLW